MARKKQLRFETELVPIGDLKEHPRNYREHPEDQLQHIAQSIREHGFYRNVVVAKDNTILAGHGVVRACNLMGLRQVPVLRLPVSPKSAAALKVLTGDNEIESLSQQDDRKLTEILREIAEKNNLLGTGYDMNMLAGLVYVTRPKHEIESFDHAAHWVGMPEYEKAPASKDRLRIIVSFESEDDREAFLRKLGLFSKVGPAEKSMWYPWRPPDDVKSVQFSRNGSK